MKSTLVILVTALLLLLQSGMAAGDDRGESNRKRWQSMSSEEKMRVTENYRAWKARPPESRERIRRNFETYRELTPEEQLKLRERYRTYRDLEPAGKERLRERLHRVDPHSDRNSQEMTREFRRMQNIPPEERMRRLERSRIWRDLSRQEREIYKKLIFPNN